MNPQRARRPTAWQVSFPDEMSDDGGDDKAEEGAERDLERLDDDLPVLNGKRKTSSSAGDRVRCSLPTLLFLLSGSLIFEM